MRGWRGRVVWSEMVLPLEAKDEVVLLLLSFVRRPLSVFERRTLVRLIGRLSNEAGVVLVDLVVQPERTLVEPDGLVELGSVLGVDRLLVDGQCRLWGFVGRINSRQRREGDVRLLRRREERGRRTPRRRQGRSDRRW